jgi:hypothetical protein
MPTTLDDRHHTRSRPMPPAAPHPADRSTAPNEVVVRVVGGEGATAPAKRARPRRGFSLGGFVLAAVAGALVVGMLLVAAAVVGLVNIGNPFGATTVDRTPPALLEQLENVSAYHAAEGTFMVRVDIENDVGILPSFIAGEHTLFNAIGTVDASVDFSTLPTDAVKINGQSVTITLPRPEYGKATVDPARSRVVDRDRGIADRIGDLFGDDTNNERQLYLLAEKKIAAAATESNLRSRAERNTSHMLEGLLARFGYTDVTAVFQKPAPAHAVAAK